MSVAAMTFVWKLAIPHDEKFVLLAYADNANDSGANIYPALLTVAHKTGYSKRSVQEITGKLEKRGLLVRCGKSRHATTLWRIDMKWVAETAIAETAIAESATPSLLQTATPSLLQTATDPSLTVHKPSLTDTPPADEMQEIIDSANKKMDAYLKMTQSPGMKRQARLSAILSYLGGRFQILTTGKRWEAFAKFVDDRQQEGQSLEVFINWVMRQKGFNIQYWPPHRMQEFWQQAFIASNTVEQSSDRVPETLRRDV